MQLDGLREADPELSAAVEAAAAAAAGGAQPLAGAQSGAGERVLGPPPGLGIMPGESGAGAKAANGTEAGGSQPPASEVTPQKAVRPEGNAAGFPVNLPSTPSNPNMLFSTINAETLEQAAQNVDFPVPEEKVRRLGRARGWGRGVGGDGERGVGVLGQEAGRRVVGAVGQRDGQADCHRKSEIS